MQKLTVRDMREKASAILGQHNSSGSPLGRIRHELERSKAVQPNSRFWVLTRPRFEAIPLDSKGNVKAKAEMNEQGKVEWVEKDPAYNLQNEQRINEWAYYFTKKSELWQLYRVVFEAHQEQYALIAAAYESLLSLHEELSNPSAKNAPGGSTHSLAAQPLISFALKNKIPLSHVEKIAQFCATLLPLGGELAVRDNGPDTEILLFDRGRMKEKTGHFSLSVKSFDYEHKAFESLDGKETLSIVTDAKYFADGQARYVISSAGYCFALFGTEVRMPEGGIAKQVENVFALFGRNFAQFWEVNGNYISGGSKEFPSCIFSMESNKSDRLYPSINVHFTFKNNTAATLEFQGKKMHYVSHEGKEYTIDPSHYLLTY